MTPGTAAKIPQRPRRAEERDARDARIERLRAIYNISNILTTTQRSDTVLRMILKEAVKATRATSGSLILIDRATGVLNIEIAHNIDPVKAGSLKLRVGEGVTGWVAKTGEPLLVGDVRKSRHYVRIKSDVRSELAAPLITAGEVVGVINVDSNRANAFTEDDKDLLAAIAAQSARVMHAASLYSENRRKAERLETLFNVAGAVVSEPVLEDVLRRVTDEVRRLMDARVCSIVLLDEKGEFFEIKAVSGRVSPEYARRERFSVAGSIIGHVTRTREQLYVPDVRVAKGYRLTAVARESGLCSLLAIPMVFLDRPVGVLNIYTSERKEFTAEDVALVKAFAGHAAVAIVNAQRYQRIFRGEEMLRSAEKFSLLGTLAAEIAHEIRNPLTILSMLVHSISEDKALSEDSQTDLAVMQTKLGHINKIVEQVLDFAKPPARETEPANLNQVLEDVCILVGHKASATGHKIRKKLARHLPVVHVNPGEIEQAVLNLAINGLEAMEGREGTLHISSALVRDRGGEWAALRVKDEGCGLDEEKIQRIFMPYFTMREHGTGLGLFITRRIVTQHGGMLKVRSKPGGGATFEILLPTTPHKARP